MDGADGPMTAVLVARWAEDTALGVERSGSDSCYDLLSAADRVKVM